jgi:hypothetical protein
MIEMLKFCASAWLAAMLLAGSVSPPALAAGPGPGQADGALLLDKTPTALTQAYALEVVEPPEMRMPNAPERMITLIFADRPLPAGGRFDDMIGMERAFKGQLRGLVLEIDPAAKTVLSGRTLIPQDELPQYFSLTGNTTEVALTGFAEDKAKGMITGKITTTGPLEVVNFDNKPGPKTYSFNVIFNAAVAPAPKLTATLEGDKAKASEQGQTLKRFLQAVSDGNPNAIRAIVTKDHPALTMLTPEGLGQIKAMIFADGNSVDEIYALLTKVYVYGQTSTVLLRHPDGWSSYPLALEDGKWKMGY